MSQDAFRLQIENSGFTVGIGPIDMRPGAIVMVQPRRSLSWLTRWFK